jgi:hypothetical protein
MTVKKQKKIKFVNDCKCLVDYEDLERAILWKQSKPGISIKHIFLFGNYAAVTVDGNKIHIHRLLMEYWLQMELPFQASVHHINENKLDDRKENLSVMVNNAHNSIHMKGRSFSEDHKRKIGQANHKRVGMKMKKRVNIPINELSMYLDSGYSIKKIAEIYHCDWSTVKARIIENHDHLKEG